MTVENTKNKMSPLQMGVTAEFPFNFAVLLQDPTEEEALKAIKAKVVLANGKEIDLVYDVDYTVELNTDRLGGTLTVNDIRTTDDYITIYRQYEQTQEVDYRDFNSAPAETFEQCFDKLTMLSQQQQEEINRSIKLPVSTKVDASLSLPEPIAGRTLKWNEEETGLINSDVSIDEIDDFVKSANESAENATKAAENATKAAENATKAAENATEIVRKTADFNLNKPFILLEGKYFDAPVYNVSWLQSNAGFTGSLALHPSAYNALLIEQNPNVEVGTTVDNYTKRGLSVKLNTEDYTDYDFVLNTTSQTFRCPLKINKASGRAVVGNGMTLGLTTGTQTAGMVNDGNAKLHAKTEAYGANTGVTKSSSDISGGDITIGITTDPTKSGIETSDQDLYLYFYVGETVQNANLVNVGRVEEKLSDCITRSDCKAYIVETYVNGSSWYRVYSDGWCEQGGYALAGATITFLKPFIDTNYYISEGRITTSSVTTRWTEISFSNKTPNSIVWSTTNGVPCNWKACGYIA